jgi:hypothetical protein
MVGVWPDWTTGVYCVYQVFTISMKSIIMPLPYPRPRTLKII